MVAIKSQHNERRYLGSAGEKGMSVPGKTVQTASAVLLPYIWCVV